MIGRLIMSIKRIKILSELLTEQMNHWMLYPLALTFMGILREASGTGSPSLLLWIACGLFPIVFFLLRCKIGHLFPFIFLHLVIALFTLLIPNRYLAVKILCVVCALGYTLYSHILRLKQDSLYSSVLPLPVGIAVSALAIWLQHSQGTKEWDAYYWFTLIVVTALYLIISYIDRYLDFLTLNQGTAGFLPAREMFRSGMGLAIGYALLGSFILFLSSQFEWMAGILQPLKRLLLRFLRFLFSNLPEPEPDGDILPEEMMSMEQMDGDMLPKPSKPFWLWKVLEAIAVFLFICAVVAAVVVLIFKLVQLIRKHLVLGMFKQNAQLEDAVDIREKCEFEKRSGRKRQRLFNFLSSRERIRKLYQKKLMSSSDIIQDTDKSFLDIYTAREWEPKLEAEGMAEVYERARYSNREVTSADVRRMKEACSSKHAGYRKV